MNIKRALAGAVVALALLATSCSGDPQAEVASENLSTAADNFEILRRVTQVNGITDEYLLEVIGYCSIHADVFASQLEVTCLSEGEYYKHFFGLSDNTPYVVEQLNGANVSTDFYRVVYRPQTLLPNIDLGG